MTGITPRWKACERPLSENFPFVVAKVWFSSMTTHDLTRHSRIGTCCKISVGNVRLSSIQSEFDTRRILSVFCLEGTLIRASFHLRWKHQLATISWLTQEGCKFYASEIVWLWQATQPPRGLCWNIAHRWLLLCVLSVSSIKIFS
jgi:hypothetical protein